MELLNTIIGVGTESKRMDHREMMPYPPEPGFWDQVPQPADGMKSRLRSEATSS